LHSCEKGVRVNYLQGILFDRDETELIGQDGHIYKGRFEGLDRMPDLPPVRGFHYRLKFCCCLHRSPFAITFSFLPILSTTFLFRSLAYFLSYLFVDKSKKTLGRKRKT